MNFGQAISTCLSKYATFSGCASRPEFWWFFLFQILVSVAASMIGDTIRAGQSGAAATRAGGGYAASA